MRTVDEHVTLVTLGNESGSVSGALAPVRPVTHQRHVLQYHRTFIASR